MYGVVIDSKDSYDMYGRAGEGHNILTTTAPTDGTYKIIAKVKRQASADSYLTFTLGSNSTNVTIYNTDFEEISRQASVTAGGKLQLSGRNYNNDDRLYLQDIKIIRLLAGSTANVAVIGIPRELKDISQKASITIFGVNTDNSWFNPDKETDESKYLSNLETWKVDFCKSKGSYHSSQKVQSYNMVGYGYLIYNVVGARIIKINNENYRQIASYNYGDGIIFLKPGDKIECSGSFGNSDIWLVYDYY